MLGLLFFGLANYTAITFKNVGVLSFIFIIISAFAFTNFIRIFLLNGKFRVFTFTATAAVTVVSPTLAFIFIIFTAGALKNKKIIFIARTKELFTTFVN